MQIAIAMLAVALVLACVVSLVFLYRHQKASQAAIPIERDPRE